MFTFAFACYILAQNVSWDFLYVAVPWLLTKKCYEKRAETNSCILLFSLNTTSIMTNFKFRLLHQGSKPILKITSKNFVKTFSLQFFYSDTNFNLLKHNDLLCFLICGYLFIPFITRCFILLEHECEERNGTWHIASNIQSPWGSYLLCSLIFCI